MKNSDSIAQAMGLSSGARFFRADLHVHTPCSSDMGSGSKSASPTDVVNSALGADLDVIAITDHNTVDWCERVRYAARDTQLHVLPGVEISTKHGHLLAIFDEDCELELIRELLIRAGFGGDRYGSLAAASTEDMDKLAEWINEMGGLAIAAHVDSNNGLMTFRVGDEKRRVAGSPFINAFEVTNSEKRSTYESGLFSGVHREVPCVTGSDCREPNSPTHEVSAIGSRYVSLKMEAVSVYGIKQALLDPAIRVRFPNEDIVQPGNTIEAIWVNGGFLDGQFLRFSRDLTCFIGDTGTGKSFALELVRQVLMQNSNIGKISDEISSLFAACLRGNCRVCLIVRKSDSKYLIERTFEDGTAHDVLIYRINNSTLEPLDSSIHLPTFFPIKAYSQSEILEFARQPESRLSLTDDLIHIEQELSQIKTAKASLRSNAIKISNAERLLDEALDEVEELGNIQEQIRRTSEFLDHPRVKSHAKWVSERQLMDRSKESILAFEQSVTGTSPVLSGASFFEVPNSTPNKEILSRISKVGSGLNANVKAKKAELLKIVENSLDEHDQLRNIWSGKYKTESDEYRQLLDSIDTEGLGLNAISKRLEKLQTKEGSLLNRRKQIRDELQPEIDGMFEQREKLLTQLQSARLTITARRKAKAKDLTQALGGRITVKVKPGANGNSFLKELDTLSVGSRIRKAQLSQMADQLHPVPFVKSLLGRDFAEISRISSVGTSIFERLLENIKERKLDSELYECQLADVDDIIEIRFQIAPSKFRDLEKLAHGQKCTVVLAIAMAEGNFPLIVDQPEDALHAPYIEQNIVSSLRSNRGKRQFVFATRNANVLVSGDAEQVVVMEADADGGRIIRTGSIDQYSTRDLILLHLEGGKTAFERKRQKYGIENT